MLQDSAADIKGIRIGYDAQYATQGVDPELAEAVLAGVRVLEGLGADIVEVSLPALEEYLAAWPTLCSTEAVAAHDATYSLSSRYLWALVSRLAGHGGRGIGGGVRQGEQSAGGV